MNHDPPISPATPHEEVSERCTTICGMASRINLATCFRLPVPCTVFRVPVFLLVRNLHAIEIRKRSNRGENIDSPIKFTTEMWRRLCIYLITVTPSCVYLNSDPHPTPLFFFFFLNTLRMPHIAQLRAISSTLRILFPAEG